jgi:hypothetical protein
MSKQEMPESGGFEYLNPMEKKELLEGAWEANGWIEKRFLSAQADAFAQSEREEKASACSARNDSLSWVAGKRRGPGVSRASRV